ncbi:hypothetical protein V6N13_094636 [Hibiscus sabdariffa]
MKALNLPRCLLQRWTLIENLWQLQTDVLMSGIGLCGTVDPKHKNNGSYASKVVASTITNQGDGSISSLMDKEDACSSGVDKPVAPKVGFQLLCLRIDSKDGQSKGNAHGNARETTCGFHRNAAYLTSNSDKKSKASHNSFEVIPLVTGDNV